MGKCVLLIIFIGLCSCSRTKSKETLEEMESRLLSESKASRAPIHDTFLQDENYVGPLNDQLNPFEREKNKIDLFPTEEGQPLNQKSKKEFPALENLSKQKEDLEKISEGVYSAKDTESYNEILSIEKLSLEEDEMIEKRLLEHDWQTGKKELSMLLDVAPLSEKDLRDFLSEGRVERKPELPLRNNDLLKAAYNGPLESIKYLLGKGLEIDTKNKRGDTALIIAVRRNRFEVASFLLSAGADSDLKNRRGESAKRLAGKSSHQKLKSLFR